MYYHAFFCKGNKNPKDKTDLHKQKKRPNDDTDKRKEGFDTDIIYVFRRFLTR